MFGTSFVVLAAAVDISRSYERRYMVDVVDLGDLDIIG